MNKPYVSTDDPSDSGLYVSMVSDASILPEDLIVGCNDCWNGLSDDDMNQGSNLWLDWEDLGDSGVLCPACKEKNGGQCK